MNEAKHLFSYDKKLQIIKVHDVYAFKNGLINLNFTGHGSISDKINFMLLQKCIENAF